VKSVADLGLKRPWFVIGFSSLLALLLLVLAAVPTLFPQLGGPLPALRVDTDPENMLAADEPARVFHREAKDRFDLHDQIVVGVLRPDTEEGVFTPEVLTHVYELVETAESLDGVVRSKILAPSTVDNIEQAGVGAVSFNWLMPAPPQTQAEADAVREKLLNLPMFEGSLIAPDGRSLLLYIPIESKDMSHRISQELLAKIDSFGDSGGEEYHITGLPVANDTFGVQMFLQMAISAPMAMVLIFVLLLLFFKKFRLVLSPMIVALLSVIITMGLLVVTGNTIHIMSSMIPIFIMPIAVLDSVHFLSEFYDRYPQYRDRGKTVRETLKSLWRPMLFTSLTTAAGFGSLVLAPIPPVQVFGLFVAIGVIVAWLLTILFIPAYIALMKESSLEGYGLRQEAGEGEEARGLLRVLSRVTYRRPRTIVAVAVVLLGLAAVGILRIQINDNPVKWFEPDHRIRVADQLLNERFAGTYPAYLNLRAEEADAFKDPELLRYLREMQDSLEASGNVGKTQSITDLVQTVYRELLGGGEEYFRVPDSSAAVAQTVLTYESSHRPDDVYHLVTPDFSEAALWFQLKSGDNQDMLEVVGEVEDYLAANPPPQALQPEWFGLTYINVVWQDKMVAGMLSALLSAFVVVLVLMVVLFRSFLWGLLAMVPLTVTIAVIYGIIGFIGKDYDMPVAVLSSLSLGLAVDYAIHFLARSRQKREKHASWGASVDAVFGEPARAIARNIIVVGVGFLPLLLAPLVPYQTVGYLISSILVVAGAATLLLLPALLTLLARRAFPAERSPSNPPSS